jgi:SAM-dependent methyltransferase
LEQIIASRRRCFGHWLRARHPDFHGLVEEGFDVYGIDPSPRMIAAFRERVPQARSACESVEDSRLFARKFDGVVAWGVLFLLSAETQIALIRKVASILNPRGQFMFTAPHQECEWLDTLTEQKCISLGAAAYRRILASEGLALVGDAEDEGQNYYYFAASSVV